MTLKLKNVNFINIKSYFDKNIDIHEVDKYIMINI